MRRNPSATERRLWRLLRDRRLEGLKFRRQIPIGPYFADFVWLSARLIVERPQEVFSAILDAAKGR
jgi:very-short-patch-repair endonuclease